MLDTTIPKIRYIGNSPLLIEKIKEHFKYQLEMIHYHDVPKEEPFAYFIVIDPIEEGIERIRIQELWKRKLKATNPSVKMLVIDWWQCTCNGFVSPMDIPELLPDLLSKTVCITDSEHCRDCHKQMKKGIDPLFEPHGDMSPLINVVQPIDGLMEHVKKNSAESADYRRIYIGGEFDRYERMLKKKTTTIAQMPFKNELMAVSQHLEIWKTQLQSNKAEVFENMKKEVQEDIKKLQNVKNELGFN